MANATFEGAMPEGTGSGNVRKGSPLVAIAICIPLLLLAISLREPISEALSSRAGMALRRHLGGRGRNMYASLPQVDGSVVR